MGLGLVQRALSKVRFGPGAASVEHVNGPPLPIISRSYVNVLVHGVLNSPSVNSADSNVTLLAFVVVAHELDAVQINVIDFDSEFVKCRHAVTIADPGPVR